MALPCSCPSAVVNRSLFVVSWCQCYLTCVHQSLTSPLVGFVAPIATWARFRWCWRSLLTSHSPSSTLPLKIPTRSIRHVLMSMSVELMWLTILSWVDTFSLSLVSEPMCYHPWLWWNSFSDQPYIWPGCYPGQQVCHRGYRSRHILCTRVPAWCYVKPHVLRWSSFDWT